MGQASSVAAMWTWNTLAKWVRGHFGIQLLCDMVLVFNTTILRSCIYNSIALAEPSCDPLAEPSSSCVVIGWDRQGSAHNLWRIAVVARRRIGLLIGGPPAPWE